MATPDASTTQQFFRISHLKLRLGISSSTIWNWIKQGKFPRGTKLSENVTAWDRPSIEAWEKSRIDASR